MRLYSYVVARDFGFAPNPFHGFCTLATCKPDIRRTAAVGDLVIGTGSAARKRSGYLVYIMKVTEVSTFDEYWSDPRFVEKRPNMHGSKKQAFGDNIYHRPASGRLIQEDSHHSFADGSPNLANVANDTKSVNVLISSNFTYFGGEGPKIPGKFRSFAGYDICAGRGYKNRFPPEFVQELIDWWRLRNTLGYVGNPLDWSRTA
jgi:hypothetical protein